MTRIDMTRRDPRGGLPLAPGFTLDDQRIARTLTREDTSLVLHQLQERAKPVPPAQLGMIGPEAYAASHYARHTGIAAQHGANIPFVVEAWADCQRSDKRGDGSAQIQPRGACSIPVVG